MTTAPQVELVRDTPKPDIRFRSQTLSTLQTHRHMAVWATLMFFVFLGSALRVAATFRHTPLEMQATDPARWWFSATHLSSVQPIAAIDPFGYPLWLGLFITFTGASATAVAFHNAVLSVLTPWIWHRLTRELTQDSDLALMGWAVFAWLPSWISIYSYTMSETLFLPLFGAALWFSVRAYRDQSSFSYSVAALLWALASATRVFALPISLIVLAWINRDRTHRAQKLIRASLAFAIVAVPLSIRTHHILGVWHPFGFPQMNQIYMESGRKTIRFEIARDSGGYRWLYEFGSPSLYQEPLAPLSHWVSAREGFVTFSIDGDKGVADWNRALEAYRPSFQKRFQEWSENYLTFNFAPSWPDNNPDRFWDIAAIVTRWVWFPLAVFVIGGNIGYRKRFGVGASAMIAFLTTLAWTLTPLLPAVMEGRYRKPIEGLLVLNLLLLLQCRKQGPTPPCSLDFETVSS